MDADKIIRNIVKKILSENYPPGAEFDSNAPWRGQDEPEISYNLSPFETLYFNDTISILLNKKDNSKWVFENDTLKNNDDINNETIADFVNSNLKSIDRGVGIHSYEYGTSLVKMDKEIAQSLHQEFGDPKLDGFLRT